MKSVIAFAAAAAILAVAGRLGTSVSAVHGHMADAQQEIATLQYDEAAASLGEAEDAVGWARWLPRFGASAASDVRLRQASLLYWTRQYDALAPDGGDPVAAMDGSDVDLQLVVANAAHRKGLSGLTERADVIRALEESASGYLTVLKNDRFHEDAAYNFEYVMRLKEEMSKTRRPPPSSEQADGDMGQSGAPSESTSQQGFEIYIPLESQERPAGGDAGKAPGRDRKG